MSLEIIPARPEHVPQILRFIEALAEYEKLSHACVATEAQLQETLFGPRPYAEVLMAYWNGAPAAPIRTRRVMWDIG